jgi:rRNA maturation endonuclease Nob1
MSEKEFLIEVRSKDFFADIVGYCCDCNSELTAEDLYELKICDWCGSNNIKKVKKRRVEL